MTNKKIQHTVAGAPNADFKSLKAAQSHPKDVTLLVAWVKGM